jgi:hypothetical protein
MLHSHPRIAIPPETRFTLRAYDRRRRFGDLADPANRRRLGEFITGPGNSFGDLGLNRDEIVEAIVAGPATLGSAIGIVFRAYSARFGRARWGDKRPAYLLNMDIVLLMFPDAQIIHLIRDGRDCVASMKDQPWHSGGVHHAISQWRRGMDAGRRASHRLDAGQYIEVFYEDLVAVPEPQLAKICDFIGEEYDPAMIEPSRLARVAVPQRKKWHALTHDPVTTDRVGSWRQRLTPTEVALCESLFGRQLVDRGYELSGAGRAAWKDRAQYLNHSIHDAYRRSRRTARIQIDRVRRANGIAAQLSDPSRKQ